MQRGICFPPPAKSTGARQLLLHVLNPLQPFPPQKNILPAKNPSNSYILCGLNSPARINPERLRLYQVGSI
jgi:hypothetical protein